MPAERRQRGRGGARLAVACGSMCLALALLEVGQRVVLSMRGEPYDRSLLEAALQRSVDTMAAFTPGGANAAGGPTGAPGPNGQPAPGSSLGILHPYSGSERVHDTGDVLRTFRNGLPDDAYVVVVVGGSVAANWSQDVEAAFARRLAADPRLVGRDIRVLRYAHASYKEPQQLTRILYLFALGYLPDAVVNLDGFNEITSGLENARGGTNPVYPPPPVWGALLRGRRDLGPEELELLADLRDTRRQLAQLSTRALRYGLTRSSLVGTWLRSRLQGLNARRAELQERFVLSADEATMEETTRRQLHGPPFHRSLNAALALSATCWYESSLSLHAVCEARGIYYLHCLQPALNDADAKPKTPAEEALSPGPPGWELGVPAGYPLLRERGAALAARGVRFVDLTRCFADVTETLYFDACHVLPAGNLILSDVIADAFLARLPEPR